MACTARKRAKARARAKKKALNLSRDSQTLEDSESEKTNLHTPPPPLSTISPTETLKDEKEEETNLRLRVTSHKKEATSAAALIDRKDERVAVTLQDTTDLRVVTARRWCSCGRVCCLLLPLLFLIFVWFFPFLPTDCWNENNLHKTFSPVLTYKNGPPPT